MSPMDPLEYAPTPHLIFITFFVLFPLIYLCGKLTFWLVWQLALTARYLLYYAIGWIYYDEIVEQQILADLDDKEKKGKTTTIVRETTTIRRTTRFLPRKKPYMNGKSNGQIALKHPTTELATPLENEEEDTTEFEEELKMDEQNNMRHSPTEDEDESVEHSDMQVPLVPTAEVASSPEELKSPETDSGTEGHFDENFTSPLPKPLLPDNIETKSLHIDDPSEFPPLGATPHIVTQ